MENRLESRTMNIMLSFECGEISCDLFEKDGTVNSTSALENYFLPRESVSSTAAATNWNRLVRNIDKIESTETMVMHMNDSTCVHFVLSMR